MEQAVADFIEKYGIGLYIPKVHVTDVIEVLILTFLIYQIIVWIKNTKAWMLLRELSFLPDLFFLQLYLKCIPSFYCEKFADGYGNRCDCCIPAGTSKSTGKTGRKAIP